MNPQLPEESKSVAQTVCLCMIVKNEAPVIRRCLDSVKPIISHWVIIDTGSTDGTQDIIREHMRDIPGTLHEREWRDFAHNRSEALALARGQADFSLIIDADDALELPEGYSLPVLSNDAYAVPISDGPLLYYRIQLVSNRLKWIYRGVLHEFIMADRPHGVELLPIVMRRNHDGARRREPATYRRDAEILEQALITESDPLLRARYTFYLGQSYRDCRDLEKSIAAFLARAEMGGWQEEVYVSLWQVAYMKEVLGRPQGEVLAAYEAAISAGPMRAEAAHAASRYCRVNSLYAEGYRIAKACLGMPLPEDALFTEPWIYETGLLDEFSINAYWAGQYQESLDACLKILETGKLGGKEASRVATNARMALEQVNRSVKAPQLGPNGQTHYATAHGLDPQSPALPTEGPFPRVLLAIFAQNNESELPLYLKCVEDLDYPKSSVVLFVRTFNNRDQTGLILREWIARVGAQYAAVELDTAELPEASDAARFEIPGQVRNEGLRKATEHRCDFYFVSEVTNFIRRFTLKDLVALKLPIVAPLLRSVVPTNPFSNYHADIDANGYYKHCDQYDWILNRWVRGLFEVPVVNGTYLVRSDVIGRLTHFDQSGRHSYVVFSESARKAHVPQYFDNRQIYGYIATDKPGDAEAVRTLMANA